MGSSRSSEDDTRNDYGEDRNEIMWTQATDNDGMALGDISASVSEQ